MYCTLGHPLRYSCLCIHGWLPPPGPSISNLVFSYTSAMSSSPSFKLVVAIMFVSSLISSLNFFSYDKILHCIFIHKLTMFLRVMQGRLRSQEGGQLSKKRKFPNATIPLLRSLLSRMLLLPRTRSPSPRMRSPSMQLGTSPLTSTTHTCYQSQSAIGDIDLNVKLEQEEI
jgi:hypothetical protein